MKIRLFIKYSNKLIRLKIKYVIIYWHVCSNWRNKVDKMTVIVNKSKKIQHLIKMQTKTQT